MSLLLNGTQLNATAFGDGDGSEFRYFSGSANCIATGSSATMFAYSMADVPFEIFAYTSATAGFTVKQALIGETNGYSSGTCTLYKQVELVGEGTPAASSTAYYKVGKAHYESGIAVGRVTGFCRFMWNLGGTAACSATDVNSFNVLIDFPASEVVCTATGTADEDVLARTPAPAERQLVVPEEERIVRVI